MGSKIARITGYIFCGIMLVLCIVLIFVSLAFSSEETVNIFGANIYVVDQEDIATAPKGSAVIVNPCAPYEVDEGRLVLYKKDDGLSLGYGKGYEVLDGVYRMTVLENNKDVVISESSLIGKADYCSEFLGRLIGFIKSPIGVFVLAVIPCLLLVVYDIIRAAALRRPLPEVVPQVKNKASEPRYSERGISVNAEGKGTYSRTAAVKPASAANDVLFTYTARQARSEKTSERRNTPIIPLTDKTGEKSEIKPKNAGTMRPDTVASETVRLAKISESELKAGSSDKKAEPLITTKSDPANDAFFAQTSVPHIQKSAYMRNTMNKSDESEKNDDTDEVARPQKTSSKRSTEIIANKRVEDLMTDDDDIRDKSRYNDAGEIVSGFNKRV